MAQNKFVLRGFSALLGQIAEDYHISASDVLLLLQTHADECSTFFRQGESYASTINGKLENAIQKELDEKPNQNH